MNKKEKKQEKSSKGEGINQLMDGTMLPKFEVIEYPTTKNGILIWGLGKIDDLSKIKNINDIHCGINREINPKNLDAIMESIQTNGYAGGIAVVIYKNHMTTGDGRHRLFSLIRLNVNGFFSFRYADTLEEYIQILKGMNTTGLIWNNRNYIKTYASLGMEAYVVLNRSLMDYALTPSVAAAIISNVSLGLAKKMIKDGTLSIDNSIFAFKRLRLVNDFFLHFNCNSDRQRILEGLVEFIASIGWSEFERVFKALFVESQTMVYKAIDLRKKSSIESMFKTAYKNIMGIK